MAIILYCRNGHDLCTYDPVFIGRIGPRQAIQLIEQRRRDAASPRQPFCTQCGASTLDACQYCEAKIGPASQPAYCANCGKPFPWTESAFAAAAEYTDELMQLTHAEKAELKNTLADLTADTPRTPLAISRFKKFAAKIGPGAGETLSKIIVNVVTETAKRHLGWIP